MRASLRIMIACLIVCGLMTLPRNEVFAAGKIQTVKESVVKIFVSASEPIFSMPWQSAASGIVTGSGVIIEGNRILTNAHVVSYARYIEVKTSRSDKRYTAKIEAVGHDCDLAVLTVEDEEFFEGLPTIDIAPLPALQSSVLVVGFPKGGNEIAVTEGVVSRIDVVSYAHSMLAFMAVQIDAAINSGNSGGPVIQDGKLAGVAFQSLNEADNIGYMIPGPIINHFLDDLEDDQYDGFPAIGIYWNESMNPSFRSRYGLEEHDGGVVLTHIVPSYQAHDILKEGDAVMAVDGVPVGADGTVPFSEGLRLPLSHLVDNKQVGETVTFDILRDGKAMEVEVTLEEQRNLVPWKYYFERPPYYIHGGLVFTVLSIDLLLEREAHFGGYYPPGLHYYLDGPGQFELGKRQNVVLLSSVLPDDLNAGYHDISLEVVSYVNGTFIDSFETFVKTLHNSEHPYDIIETELKNEIVLKRKAVEAGQPRILENYGVAFPYSDDVAELIKE